MPKSKKRKKHGKAAKFKGQYAGGLISPDAESSVSLQDLINLVAYQQYVDDGSIVPSDVEVHVPDEIPVMVGEGESKRQIDTAAHVPDTDEVSVKLTDPDVIRYIHDDTTHFSIANEETN